MTDQPTIGHNRSPFDAIKDQVDDLYMEAKNWLDGAAIENDAQARAIEQLLDMLRATEKERVAEFTAEKKPHLDAGRAVDEKWRPLKETIARAVDACRAVLTPWRAKQDAERRALIEAKQKEADEARRKAEEAIRQSTADIEAREQAEQQLKDAKRATAEANKIGKAATGLRRSYEAKIVDANAAIKHYWSTDQDAFIDLVQQLADRDVKLKRTGMPGIEIIEKVVAR